MSGGMWFMISIPTEIYEKQLVESRVKKNESEGSYQTLSAYKTSSTDTFSTAYSRSDSEEGLKTAQECPDKNNIVINVEEVEAPPKKLSTKHLKTILEDEKKKEDKDDNQSRESEQLVSFVDKDISMEKIVKETLDVFGINDAVWVPSAEGRFHQISFPCEQGYKCDVILRALMAKGVGVKGGSTLSAMPCAVFYQDVAESDLQISNAGSDVESEGGSEESLKSKSEAKKNKSCSKAVQHKFLKSVTARLTVAQVVESVRPTAQLNFDFVTLLILASVIAAFGLVTESLVILVPSMLISPLMGPILAGTFGTLIEDNSLRNMGIKTECIGLCLCLAVGALFGAITSPFDYYWSGHVWPTNAMIERGVYWNLWIGFMIALCSGPPVALSVVGGSAGAMVGAAISASLLPPAVNAGLLWALSAVKAIKAAYEKETILVETNSTATWLKPSLAPPPGYDMVYASTMDKECLVLGFISLSLTFINIICIYLTTLLFLKIKEVAPHTSMPQISRFWKKDIKIARDYNKTLHHQDARTLGKQFLLEWANLNNIDPKEVFKQSHQAKLTQMETLKDLVNDVEADEVYQTVVRYVPNAAPQALSQCINLITWPAPEVTFASSRPSVWDLGFSAESSSDIAIGKETLFKSSEYHQLNHVPNCKNRFNVFSKKKQMKMPTWSVDTMSCWPTDSYSDLDIKNKQRNSSLLVTTVNSYHSEGYLRPSGSSQNPYTLWPSTWLKSSRFVVTPVTETDRSPPRSFLGKGLPSSNLDTVTTC